MAQIDMNPITENQMKIRIQEVMKLSVVYLSASVLAAFDPA